MNKEHRRASTAIFEALCSLDAPLSFPTSHKKKKKKEIMRLSIYAKFNNIACA